MSSRRNEKSLANKNLEKALGLDTHGFHLPIPTLFTGPIAQFGKWCGLHPAQRRHNYRQKFGFLFFILEHLMLSGIFT